MSTQHEIYTQYMDGFGRGAAGKEPRSTDHHTLRGYQDGVRVRRDCSVFERDRLGIPAGPDTARMRASDILTALAATADIADSLASSTVEGAATTISSDTEEHRSMSIEEATRTAVGGDPMLMHFQEIRQLYELKQKHSVGSTTHARSGAEINHEFDESGARRVRDRPSHVEEHVVQNNTDALAYTPPKDGPVPSAIDGAPLPSSK